MGEKLVLNNEDEKLFKMLRAFIFVVFILGSTYFVYRLLFPSEYFTQSFKNTNSLKNTITDVAKTGDTVSFFASTSQDFSEIKVNVELEKKSTLFKNSNIEVKKSYKSFFYPESIPHENQPVPEEHIIAASTESIFIVGKDQKNPIDNPLTFNGLGYTWDNIEKEKIDLSNYEKKKLLNITSTHPNGTILETDKNNYYTVSEGTKEKINNSQVENFKNNIIVQEKSLETSDNCQLENNFIFKKKYNCTIPLEKIISFSGKDYHFNLSNVSDDIAIKEINLEFKKTPNKDNLFIFIADIKNKIKVRFSGEKL